MTPFPPDDFGRQLRVTASGATASSSRMKIWLLVMSVVFSTLCQAQTPMQESQKNAIKLFPDLGVPGSKLNKRFLELVEATKRSDPQMMQRDEWPMTVARQAAADTGATPATPAEPEPQAVKTGVSLGQAPAGYVTVHGKVVQRTADGLLIQGQKSGPTGQFWLKGFDSQEGKTITASARKVAPFAFTAVSGEARMLDCYDASR